MKNLSIASTCRLLFSPMVRLRSFADAFTGTAWAFSHTNPYSALRPLETST